MRYYLTLFLLYQALTSHCQMAIGNYVSNGSFEKIVGCNNLPIVNRADGWSCPGTDTTFGAGALYSTDCFLNAPNTGSGYQMPAQGKAFCKISPYCTNVCFYPFKRVYPKNRLKSQLKLGESYCVKMQIVLTNSSPRSIDNLAFCFVNNNIDTLNYPFLPLTYLNPQIEFSTIVIDTLNWATLSGTFTATGSEKFLMIGNFKSDVQTTTSVTLPSSAEDWAEYFIDAVSCIPVNLPAYAGPDRRCIIGDSVYLGRESDFAIDPYCVWYQLPNLTTALDTSSGLWVKPVVTTTYVVRQELECGSPHWDTVVVYKDQVGIEEYNLGRFQIYPNPVQDLMHVKWDANLSKNVRLEVYDLFGQLLCSDILEKGKQEFSIDVSALPAGVYQMQIRSENAIFRRKFAKD